MTSKNQRSRAKKPLETTLGQAPTESYPDLDLAHMRKPLQTSLFGLRQVLGLYNTATKEVQQYITYECEVLYECRICRTIFRSLANFVLHKRNFCKDKFHRNDFKEEEEEKEEDGHSGNFVVDLSEDRSVTPDLDKKRVISPVIDKLKQRQEISQLAKQALNEDLSSNLDNDVILVENDVILEKIDTTNSAVFQSGFSNQLMKSEVMEIHGIFESNEVVLGTDGKVCTFETDKKNARSNIPKSNLICTECDLKFSTKKTLSSHIKYKHNKTCIIYPCPDCKDTFANAWCVYRHLYKVHRRTTAEVRKLRTQIHFSAIKKDHQQELPLMKPMEIIEEQDEVQWLNNVEGDNDLQMCGGCGKRFERKAALHSHSQMCLKRIAVCNNIKGNKKNADKKAIIKVEQDKNVSVEPLKGSAKRKPKKVTKLEEKRKAKTEPKIDDQVVDISSDESCILIEEVVKEAKPIRKCLKRKRATSCDFSLNEQKKRKKLLAFNEETDESFIAKAVCFMSEKELKCNSCQLCFTSFYRLLWHMSLHFSWFRFQCSKCSFMSFNKYDCTLHVVNFHKVNDDLINSIVLPIPKWKIVSMAHDFKLLEGESNKNELENDKTIEQNKSFKCETEENNKIEEQVAKTEEITESPVELEELICQNSEELEEVSKPDEENSVTETTKTVEENSINDNSRNSIITESNNVMSEGSSSPEDVKFGGPALGAGPSKITRDRPIRSRTRSVKTLQDDFIYDLNKVLQLNDSSIKSYKAKKNSTEKKNLKTSNKNSMKDV